MGGEGSARGGGGARYNGNSASDAPSLSPSPSPWVGSSVPLATNHAKVAVCARRGWVAVITGSMVSYHSCHLSAAAAAAAVLWSRLPVALLFIFSLQSRVAVRRYQVYA